MELDPLAGRIRPKKKGSSSPGSAASADFAPADVAAHPTTNDSEHQEHYRARPYSEAAVAHPACTPKHGTKRRFSPQVAAHMTPPTLREFGSHRDQYSGLGERWSNEIDTHGGSNQFQFLQSDPGPASCASVPATKNLPAEDETAFGPGGAEPRMKRSRTVSYEHPESGQPRRQTRRSLAGNGPQAAKKFACPFYMRKPLEHYECLRYNLHRIKDVKQHLERKHRQPDFYCPRCFVIFETGGRRDEHVRDATCKRLPNPRHEGMTQDQKMELSKCGRRGKDPEGQWSAIWKVLFPTVEQDRSKSIYVGGLLEESAPFLRSYWEKNHTKILDKILPAQPLDAAELKRVNSVVLGFFDHIEATAGERGEREARYDEDDLYQSSFLTAVSDPANDPSSGMPSLPLSQSYSKTPALSALASLCGSLESAGVFVATDDGYNLVSHWDSPTRSSTIGTAAGNRSGAVGPPLLTTSERPPSVFPWDSTFDIALEPEFLPPSDLQHPPEELGELPLPSASDYPIDPLTQSYPDATLPFP